MKENLEHNMELEEKEIWHNEVYQLAKMYNGAKNLPIEKMVLLTKKYVENEWMGGVST
ncbi:MAG: hypothetical protein WC822_00465 [Candidatus Paceibacterota bacterium]|jgi:hypothetical protein